MFQVNSKDTRIDVILGKKLLHFSTSNSASILFLPPTSNNQNKHGTGMVTIKSIFKLRRTVLKFTIDHNTGPGPNMLRERRGSRILKQGPSLVNPYREAISKYTIGLTYLSFNKKPSKHTDHLKELKQAFIKRGRYCRRNQSVDTVFWV